MTSCCWPAGSGDPPSYSAHAPSTAMNEALVDWLMAPEVSEEPLTLDDFLARPSWHKLALCRGETRSFFSTAPGNLAKAQALCEGCPVRQDCLEVALGDPDLMGLWGGTTESERREMRRASA